MKQSVRCFLSVEIPDSFREELARIQGAFCRAGVLRARWVPPENRHITLKFLGDVSPHKLSEVQKRLSAASWLPFFLKLGAPGVFHPSRVKVLWCGLFGAEGLMALHQSLEAALAGLFPPESGYHPHITLARVKEVTQKDQFFALLREWNISSRTAEVCRFKLMASDLTPRGAVYRTLTSFTADSFGG